MSGSDRYPRLVARGRESNGGTVRGLDVEARVERPADVRDICYVDYFSTGAGVN